MNGGNENAPALLADIGGTNARFALGEKDGTVHSIKSLICRDYGSPAEAARAYLDDLPATAAAKRAAFALASPVSGDVIAMTNHPWTFSIEETRKKLGLDRLEAVNDFTAIALCVPHLTDRDVLRVGPGKAVATAPIAVLGPGTGLGVSGLIPVGGGWAPLASEGGHATMAAATGREQKILETLRQTFGHVSVERVLSGPGLVNIHDAISYLNGPGPSAPVTPAEITERALDDACPVCREALDVFFDMLGTAASNLALDLGARGGVFIAGGIVPKLADAFSKSGFRRRFEDKGRFGEYLSAIPTAVITYEFPAFQGLNNLLATEPGNVFVGQSQQVF